jgi:hypothetical protein
MSEALFHCENYFHIGAYAECVEAAKACADVDELDALRRDVFVARSRIAAGEGEVCRAISDDGDGDGDDDAISTRRSRATARRDSRRRRTDETRSRPTRSSRARRRRTRRRRCER